MAPLKNFLKILSEIDEQWGYDSKIDEFINIANPIRFHEWLIRKEIDEEDIDEYVISSYLHFREWLDDKFKYYSLGRRRYRNNEPKFYHEDSYGDLELEEYYQYCKAQRQAAITDSMIDEIFYEDRLQEARRQFLGAEKVDDYDAVFDDEGNWLGML